MKKHILCTIKQDVVCDCFTRCVISSGWVIDDIIVNYYMNKAEQNHMVFQKLRTELFIYTEGLFKTTHGKSY